MIFVCRRGLHVAHIAADRPDVDRFATRRREQLAKTAGVSVRPKGYKSAEKDRADFVSCALAQKPYKIFRSVRRGGEFIFQARREQSAKGAATAGRENELRDEKEFAGDVMCDPLAESN